MRQQDSSRQPAGPGGQEAETPPEFVITADVGLQQQTPVLHFPAEPVLTAQALHQLEQQHSQSHPDAAQPSHQHSPIGPPAAPSRKYSSCSTCSSTALLGRMSGISLPRSEIGLAAAAGAGAGAAALQRPPPQQQLQPEPQSAQVYIAELQAPHAAFEAGSMLLPSVNMPQAAVAGSANSSPPLSPNRQQAATGGSFAGAGQAQGTQGPIAAACLDPQALGLPAIATTLPVAIPGGPPSAAGALGAVLTAAVVW